MSLGLGGGDRQAIAEIAVIIPFRNPGPVLEPCLDSVAAAADRHGVVEIVLVDHASTDGSSEVAARFSEGRRAQVVRTGEGPVGRVRNVGASATEAPILSFVDSDCVVPTDYFLSVQGALSKGFDAVGSRVRLPERPHWIEAVWEPLHTPIRAEDEIYINGANFACRTEVFRRLGGFDESLEAGEDEEIVWRIREAGCRVSIDRGVVAVHLGNPKTLKEFFRQQRWHGNGALKSGDSLLMPAALISYLLLFLAILPALWLWGPMASLIAAAGHQLLPSGALLYRARVQGRPCLRCLDAFLLYHIYFAARAVGLVDQMMGFRYQRSAGARG